MSEGKFDRCSCRRHVIRRFVGWWGSSTPRALSSISASPAVAGASEREEGSHIHSYGALVDSCLRYSASNIAVKRVVACAVRLVQSGMPGRSSTTSSSPILQHLQLRQREYQQQLNRQRLSDCCNVISSSSGGISNNNRYYYTPAPPYVVSNSESGYEDRGRKMCEELPILKGILNGNVKYHNARMCLLI